MSGLFDRAAVLPSAAPTLAAGLAEPLTRPRIALVLVILLALLLVYLETARSMVAIWDSSGTFAHGYVILPISLWLIWQRRALLLATPVQPWLPAAALLLGCGLVWLLADLGEVQIVRQYAFVAMLPLAVLTLLGKRMARAMAFPLLFLLFAVPFGEAFINPLIDITANFTIDMLVRTGIPVYREGNNFTIPSGSWSVVEACSGVRYLISSITLGCLYAYLSYRSPLRRILFVLVSIGLPILANGLRAYMIVMIGHLSGMTLAVGVDHLIYGWVWFGIVMFVMFWIGSYWREDQPELTGQAAQPTAPVALASAGHSRRLLLAGVVVLVCAGLWPAYRLYLDRAQPAPAPLQLAPLATLPAAPAFTDWQPGFNAPTARFQQFVLHDGRALGIALAVYRNPPPGVELIGSGNTLAARSHADFIQLPTTHRVETIHGRQLALRETSITTPTGRMLVWHWFDIDGSRTDSDYVGKLLQIRQKLLRGTDDGAAVMVFSQFEDNPEPARARLRSFLASQLDPLTALLAAHRPD